MYLVIWVFCPYIQRSLTRCMHTMKNWRSFYELWSKHFKDFVQFKGVFYWLSTWQQEIFWYLSILKCCWSMQIETNVLWPGQDLIIFTKYPLFYAKKKVEHFIFAQFNIVLLDSHMATRNLLVKFRFSKKATKFWQNLPDDLKLTK